MEISAKKLEKLYYSKTNKELSEILGISIPTVLKLIDWYNIPRKGKGNSRRIRRDLLEKVNNHEE